MTPRQYFNHCYQVLKEGEITEWLIANSWQIDNNDDNNNDNGNDNNSDSYSDGDSKGNNNTVKPNFFSGDTLRTIPNIRL